MTTERVIAVLEDCADLQTLEEAIATYAQWVEDKTGCECDPRCVEAIGNAFDRLLAAPREVFTNQGAPTYFPPTAQLANPPVQPRISKKYRLLKVDVGWTTKPQVCGIVQILAAHVKQGDVFAEDEVIGMMEANRHLLSNTRQTCKRLWAYYKGDHAEGLEAHGNIERA